MCSMLASSPSRICMSEVVAQTMDIHPLLPMQPQLDKEAQSSSGMKKTRWRICATVSTQDHLIPRTKEASTQTLQVSKLTLALEPPTSYAQTDETWLPYYQIKAPPTKRPSPIGSSSSSQPADIYLAVTAADVTRSRGAQGFTDTKSASLSVLGY